jgi:3-hydroxyacyl-[acyl-carrier-protein] dehydratase
MPPALLFDYSSMDLDAEPLFDKEAICKINPQQYEMQHLDGILWFDDEKHLVLGYKDVTDHEFWIRGHIPGRPLMPGVIMIEAAAQVLSFYVKEILKEPGFVGFGGISNAKFRSTVSPGSRLYLLSHAIRLGKRKKTFKVQGVVDGSMVFEATIEGLRI